MFQVYEPSLFLKTIYRRSKTSTLPNIYPDINLLWTAARHPEVPIDGQEGPIMTAYCVYTHSLHTRLVIKPNIKPSILE